MTNAKPERYVMKGKIEKDEQLDALFSDYMQGGKMPSADVTRKAKKYMEAEREAETAVVPAAMTVGGKTTGQSGMKTAQKKILFLGAFLILIVTIALVFYHATKGPAEIVPNTTASLASAQLTEVSAGYRDHEFIPFVNENSVSVYKEYALKENTERYNKADVVVFYVEWKTADAVLVSTFVESDGIQWVDLSDFKQLTNEKTLGGILFRYDVGKNDCLCYFTREDYGYNIRIGTENDETVNTILLDIAMSFR